MHDVGERGFAGSDAMLAAIVSSSDDAILFKDRDAIVRSWNTGAERLYGYSAAEMIGSSVARIIPDTHRGEERRILDRILKGERVEHYETVRVAKNGRMVNVSLSVAPVERDGEIVGAAVIARDTTERRHARVLEQELQKLDFVNSVAHELRSPLSAIAGAAEILAGDTSELPEKTRRVVEVIVRQARIAERSIRDLLDLSHLSSGRFQVSVTATHLGRVLEQVRDLVPAPEGRSFDAPPPDAWVLADQGRLVQVLVNLVTNAYKYGGSRVWIETRADRALAQIAVCDDGEGIPDDLTDSVFEPFVRGQSGSDRVGTGLGLAIAQRLMEAQGGSLHYERGSPGARFVVRLPRAEAPPGD